MAEQENLATALEHIGLTWPRDPGDIITDALVVARCSTASGRTSVVYEASAGMDAIIRLGLLEAARSIETANRWCRPGDDDD